MLEAEYSEADLASHFEPSDPAFPHYGTTSQRLPTPLWVGRLGSPAIRERRGERNPLPEGPKPVEKPTPPQPAEKQGPGDPIEPKAGDGKVEKKPGFIRRSPLLTVASIPILVIAAGAGYLWWEDAEHFETTDDAFVASRQTAIAPRVTGYIVSVPVTDNQHVAAGDVIAKVDDRDYQVALDQANAQFASSKASVESVDAQTDVQNAQIEASKAQVAQAQATLDFAKQQASRYGQLAKTGAGTVENAQQYNSQLGQQQAALKSAEAAERVAERQLEALTAQKKSAEASLAVSNAQREQALLNLSYTTLKAREPGRIVNLTAAPGVLAQPGANLTMFVPDDLWISANFKETQLDRMRPGQQVTFTIDAYPERELKGHVASVQPGSGTAFSLLPAENATGNYVKVVQRVPVKIVLDNPPPDVTLGPGMSIEPSVRVDPSPSIWESLRARLDRYWGRR